MSIKKTKYFQNCLGVFQGGGCKGSAYVGAYKEAVKWGVSFSELVGTSAGSIIAVLIGAGANPKQLEEIIETLDFKKFLSPVSPINNYVAPKYSRLLKYVPNKTTKKYHRIFTHLGLYNSVYLKTWIDDKLAILLPQVQRPIKFKDLIIPTSVITTDIVSRRIEIFSQEKSLNKDVSEAVQSSCNIPFFFQPIDMRYVDGGLLSNLPSFVFDDNKEKLYNRVLAFSLESDPVGNGFNDFSGFSRALLETILEGNLDLQLALQDNLHIININTGKISATDFDKITPKVIEILVDNGKKAVELFFKNEIANVHTRIKNPDISNDSFNTNNFFTQTVDYQYDEILISDLTTGWVYEIFPTLLKWKDNNATISFLLQESTDDPDHSKFRQRFLKSLGVNVEIVKNIPFRGFVFDGNVKENCKAIILNRTNAEDIGYHSKLYSGEEDFAAIKLMREKINTLIGSAAIPPSRIILEKADNLELFALLKGVKQYKPIGVQIRMQEMEVSKLFFITKYIRGFKYRQIHNLFELYLKFGIEPFSPTKLKMADGKYTLITPPVVEKIGDNYYVVEGNTRLVYAFRNGMEKINCVVIEGVSDPLPSKGEFSAKEMLLADRVVIGEDRYVEFDYSKFRKIEKAIRNPTSCLL